MICYSELGSGLIAQRAYSFDLENNWPIKVPPIKKQRKSSQPLPFFGPAHSMRPDSNSSNPAIERERGLKVPALNIFRLFPKQKTLLLKYLDQRGLKHIQTKQLTEQGAKFALSLYFSTRPKKSYVKWIKHLKELFDIEDQKIDNYSAVVLVESTDLLYAVSYGTAHFSLARYADLDFGVDIGSRILSKYTIKNARSFGGKTTKTIITYDHITELAFDGGESVNYIKGNPFEPTKWGKSVSCGQSVQLRKRDFSIMSAPSLALMLEDALRNTPIKTPIPRSIRVKDKVLKGTLLTQLIRDMTNGNYMVSISQQQLSGVEFLFGDAYTYHLLFDGGEAEIDSELTLKEVHTLAKKHFDNDFAALLFADVEAREDGVRAFAKKMICFVDYVDSKNNHFLENGEWFEFDSNYLKNLRDAVGSIPLNTVPEITVFDEGQYQAWLKTSDKHSVVYREAYLNELLSKKYGYENYDRKLFTNEKHNVEMADLVRGDELTFVKIGKVQKLNYVVDQATNAINVLKRSGLKMHVGGKERLIRTICIWVFLEREHDISALKDLHSLIFLMKLADWRKEVLLTGLTPLVKVSYRR